MPKGYDVDIDWASYATAWEDSAHGSKGQAVSLLATITGLDRSTVYRRLQKLCGPKKKVAREASKYTEEIVKEAAIRLAHYKTITLKESNRSLSTKYIISRMEQGGLVEPDYLTVSGLNAALKKVGYRDVTPRVRVEAEYYCQQVQIDFSRSKHFQAYKVLPNGDWLLWVMAKENHEKTPIGRVRTWNTALVDEYSRLRWFYYDIDTGEKPELGLRALDEYAKRPEDEHLFRHRFDAIRADQGAFRKAQQTQRLFKSIGVEMPITSPENKQTQGKVEIGFRNLWRAFEAGLADELIQEQGDRATITLSELNRRVNEYAIQLQHENHPVLRDEISKKRLTCFQAAQRSMLKKRPPVFDFDVFALAYKEWHRTADASCMVSIDNAKLQVPGIAAGKRVVILMNMYEEYVGYLKGDLSQSKFPVSPYEYQTLGEFSQSHRLTYAENARIAAQSRRKDNNQKIRALKHPAESITPDSPFVQLDRNNSPVIKVLTCFEAGVRVSDRICSAFGLVPEDIGTTPDKFNVRRVLDHMAESGQLRGGMTEEEANACADSFINEKRMAI